MEENTLKLKILGCGDAFCSGGRRHTSFLLQQQAFNIMIDCGASTPYALKANGLNSNDIDCIILTHFHGDHYGGLPFLLLEAAKVLKRNKTLHLISPPGLEQRLEVLLGALYPGSNDVLSSLPLHFTEFKEGEELRFDKFSLTAFKVKHTPASQPHGVRIRTGGKVLSYSGDTSWHENLPGLASGADIFICECNFFEQATEHHLHYLELRERAGSLKAKKIFLTHLGDEMLNRLEEVQFPVVKDGEEIFF